jgi:hypothetical protein
MTTEEMEKMGVRAEKVPGQCSFVLAARGRDPGKRREWRK